MQKITLTLCALFFLMTPVFVSAHEADTNGSMMGTDDWNTNMMQFEDQIVNDDDLHEQMEEYMKALFNGEITNEQERQMLEWMQSDEYQPAMMSIMMRQMMGYGWNNSWSNTGMMRSWSANNTFSISGWVTMILLWTFLIFGIIVFWRSLSQPSKRK